jgi:ribosome biogenesis SPOUT family RNA methylase Rps3
MNVVAIEYGNRPLLFSKARRFAPEGVKMLAEILEHMEFAEDGIVILDWDNSLALQPDEAAIPVIVIRTTGIVRDVGDDQRLTVEVRLNVEDLFGQDEVTAENLIDAVHQMEAKWFASIERARRN